MACKKLTAPVLDKKNVWSDDVLGREELAKKFTNLLSTIQDPFVIALNSEYGSGKSFFLKRWYCSLDPENFICLFYDAWQTDFHEHAFIPFVYSLIQQMKDNQFITIDTKLFERFQEITEKISNFIVDTTLSTITLNTLTNEKIKQIVEPESAIGNTKTFSAFLERQKLLTEFKEQLFEIVEQLNKTDQKLVIFVDELERCRPTYAVELLESIKHLFDDAKVIFILGIDRNQLRHTISNLYGSGMNSEGYLRRFFDLELVLPKPNDSQYINFLYRDFKLNELLITPDDCCTGGETLITYMNENAKLFNLSLRDIAQCFTEINIVIRTRIQQPFFPILLSFLVCLKRHNQDTYNLLGECTAEEAVEQFRKLGIERFVSNRYLRNIESFFYLGLDNNKVSYIKRRLNRLNEIIGSPNEEVETRDRARAEALRLEHAEQFRQNIQSRYYCGDEKTIIQNLKLDLSFC